MSPAELVQAVSHFAQARWRAHHFDAGRLAAFQDRRARRMVAYAHAHSPFYRCHWAGCDLQRWDELPTVDKTAMMAGFDDFNTRGVSREAAMQVALHAERTRDFRPRLGDLTVGLSSGTSGHRGLFLVSPRERAAWAGVILARALHGVRLRRTRVAFFLRSHSTLYAQASGLLIHLRYFDLMLPLDEAIGALDAYQPAILVAPPSLLAMLAAAQAAGALHIHPERLISVAETLEPQDEAALAATFHAPVHQIYQCTEGLVAVSCAHGRLHLMEDIIAVQLQSPELSFAALVKPPISQSPNLPISMSPLSPTLTDLWRQTQPIIRYRLNDLLRMDERPCPCGSVFRVVAAVEGRQDDVCYFWDAQGQRRPFFPDTIRRMVLLSDPRILDYQARQAQDGELCVHLAVGAPEQFAAAAASVRASATEILGGYGCTADVIDIVAGIPAQPPGVKRRRVQRAGTARSEEESVQRPVAPRYPT